VEDTDRFSGRDAVELHSFIPSFLLPQMGMTRTTLSNIQLCLFFQSINFITFPSGRESENQNQNEIIENEMDETRQALGLGDESTIECYDRCSEFNSKNFH
jgi:hypothetical protein